MKVRYKLSSKSTFEGLSEVLLMIQPYIGKEVRTMRAKSGVFIESKYFDAKSGVMALSRKYNETQNIKYHKEQADKLHQLVSYIDKRYNDADRSKMTTDWLKNVVAEYHDPERMEAVEMDKPTFYELAEEYISKKPLSYGYVKGFRVVVRAVLRYEGFIRATEKSRADYTFDVDTITRNDIEDFRDYLRNEKALADKYPNVFKRLLIDYPVMLIDYRNHIEGRGENTVIGNMKRLKSFFTWLVENDRTKNRPFDGVRIGTEQAITPIYITIDERNKIASTSMPTQHLETQRDIFIFQCLVGCRVGDLMKMTERNITGRILTYTPHKTKNEGEYAFTARVPLIDEAMALIDKYRGIDKQGRLFPYISPQRYNDAIKEAFLLAGITRNVEVRNALTEEIEIKPINEIASSHMARRTFVGNLYFKVQDPNLIGQMSGHADGSKAFKRYRKIEDETLANIVEYLK